MQLHMLNRHVSIQRRDSAHCRFRSPFLPFFDCDSCILDRCCGRLLRSAFSPTPLSCFSPALPTDCLGDWIGRWWCVRCSSDEERRDTRVPPMKSHAGAEKKILVRNHHERTRDRVLKAGRYTATQLARNTEL